MPLLVFTQQELFDATCDRARQVSEEIVRLADLGATPLAPGESVAERHHKIARLGKQLAELFLTMDKAMETDVQRRLATQPSEQKPESN